MGGVLIVVEMKEEEKRERFRGAEEVGQEEQLGHQSDIRVESYLLNRHELPAGGVEKLGQSVCLSRSAPLPLPVFICRLRAYTYICTQNLIYLYMYIYEFIF